MATRIRIHTDSTGWIDAEISEEKNPVTAGQIIDVLPIESKTRTWGDEVYFEIPVQTTEENSQVMVEVGDLAYWPAGNCFCIFFGQTPASTDAQPAAASAVNVFGKITGDPEAFKQVRSGEKITVKKA